MTTEQQINQMKSEIESKLKAELNDALTAGYAETQKALDGMAASFQDAMDKTLANAKASLQDGVVRERRTDLFSGLFEKHSASFLKLVDDEKTKAPDLQRALYVATDAAVGALAHGAPVKFYHFTKAEVIGAVATAGVVTLAGRALLQKIAARIQARRPAPDVVAVEFDTNPGI